MAPRALKFKVSCCPLCSIHFPQLALSSSSEWASTLVHGPAPGCRWPLRRRLTVLSNLSVSSSSSSANTPRVPLSLALYLNPRIPLHPRQLAPTVVDGTIRFETGRPIRLLRTLSAIGSTLIVHSHPKVKLVYIVIHILSSCICPWKFIRKKNFRGYILQINIVCLVYVKILLKSSCWDQIRLYLSVESAVELFFSFYSFRLPVNSRNFD